MTRPTLVICAAFATAVVVGQERLPAPVFTAAQAATGKAAFGKACAGCHMADLSGANEVPPLAGATFATTWGGRTTKELFDYVSGAMPPGGPAQSEETYEAILAYILQSNGAAAGPEALTKSTEVPIRVYLARAGVARE
jgi:polar amino acid transport system substrate-binding protein